jgi:hypothetical protein
MITDDAIVPRDPCTASNYWPYENYSGYKVIDVNKPYYKITNANPILLGNTNLSQVVGIFFDSSLVTGDDFEILLDPCLGTTYVVDSSDAGKAYMEFVAIAYDPSWGSTWAQYKYGADDSSTGSGGYGSVGPGTIGTIPVFDGVYKIGDSPLSIVGSLVTGNVDISVGDVIIHNAVRDSSENILIGYGSPMQLNDPASGRDVSIYGNVYFDGSLVSVKAGVFNVDGSIILNGEEVGQGKYDPPISDDLKMPYAVGGLPADTSVAYLRNKTFEQLFTELLFPTVLASIFTAKSLGFAGLTSNYAEPSTMFAPTLTATYIPGVIHNGDGTTGPNLTGDAYYYKFKLPGGAIDYEESHAGNSRARAFATPVYVGNAGATHTWSVDVSHNIGSGAYYDNKGNAGSNLDVQRIAAIISANSGTITSRNKRYWGVDSLASLTSGQVITLDSSEFATGYTKSLFYVSPSNEYIYFCYPSSFAGTPVFTVGGLTFTAIHDIGPVAVTNSYGHTENYSIWRTDGLQNGTNISIVIS